MTNSLLQRFCTEADARNVLQCLKQNKNSELMDPKCKQMITKRQITQNTGTHTHTNMTQLNLRSTFTSLTLLLLHFLFILQTTG